MYFFFEILKLSEILKIPIPNKKPDYLYKWIIHFDFENYLVIDSKMGTQLVIILQIDDARSISDDYIYKGKLFNDMSNT